MRLTMYPGNDLSYDLRTFGFVQRLVAEPGENAPLDAGHHRERFADLCRDQVSEPPWITRVGVLKCDA